MSTVSLMSVFLDLLKQIITSKKALATFAGMIIALLGRYGLEIPQETVLQLLTVLSAYILGQGVADIGKYSSIIPDEYKNNLLVQLLLSKKALATFAGLVVSILAKKGFNIPQETVNQILGMIAVYITGQGISDLGKNKIVVLPHASVSKRFP